MKDYRVTSSRSSLFQVLNVPLRYSSLVDVAEDSVNSVLESPEPYKNLLRLLGYYYRNLSLRSTVPKVVIKECFDLVKGRSSKERGCL